MNRKYLSLIIVALTFATLSQSFGQKKDLFNGTDLTGWIVYGTEKWYVEDGTIVAESGPDGEYGYLGTEGKYKDFILTLEFKQEKDGNSGLFFHSSIEGTKIAGWQAEIAPPGHDSGGIYESYGRGWLIKPDPEVSDNALKYGEWNKMKLMVKGDKVTTWLNGTKMITLEDEKIGAKSGQIALQIHSGGGLKLAFRNIVIKPIN
ncbi:MAG: DUF1080 domain-containing protein [Bacteroidota bacterium]